MCPLLLPHGSPGGDVQCDPPVHVAAGCAGVSRVAPTLQSLDVHHLEPGLRLKSDAAVDTPAHTFGGHSTHLGATGPEVEAWAWHLTSILSSPSCVSGQQGKYLISKNCLEIINNFSTNPLKEVKLNAIY